jgi:very-short-patch-repair endonuclease
LLSARALARARAMRREPTRAEALLWRELRGHGIGPFKFRRQGPIGNYIVDFCCVSRKLVVELDGDQHFERVCRYDESRTQDLEKRGFKVLRFWNGEVIDDVDAVAQEILSALEDRAKAGRPVT